MCVALWHQEEKKDIADLLLFSGIIGVGNEETNLSEKNIQR